MCDSSILVSPPAVTYNFIIQWNSVLLNFPGRDHLTQEIKPDFLNQKTASMCGQMSLPC